MSDMTPQEAQDDLDWARAVALNEAGGGEWEDVLDYLVSALETIAAEHIEYGVQYHYLWTKEWVTHTWYKDRKGAETFLPTAQRDYAGARIVARRVSEPWEVEG